MRFIVMLIVLAFPILDVLVTLRFARWTGIPALAWFIASAAAGMLLLHHERIGFRARTLAALRGDHPLMRGLLDSGRKVLAALLLILPGIVSDLIAVVLLLLPYGSIRRKARDAEPGSLSVLPSVSQSVSIMAVP